MTSAKDLHQRMVTAGATRAGEADPADQPPPLTVVAPPELEEDESKETRRFTGEVSFPISDYIVDIAAQATRRRPKRRPTMRQIDVLRRTYDLLRAGEAVTTERLVEDLAANPPRELVEKP